MINTKDTNTPTGPSIAIVDDHEVVLEGLCSFLQKNGLRNVHAFRTADQLLAHLKKALFDLYIIDIELPDTNGSDFIDTIRMQHPNAHIIVNTMHEEVWVVKTLLEKQVDAVIYKSTDLSQLLHAIEAVRQGQQYFCPKFRSSSLNVVPPTEHHPSRREQDVLREIAKGLSTKEIAARLYISENTVETHRQSLFTKLQAHNMADLMVKAIAQGYINPHDISGSV